MDFGFIIPTCCREDIHLRQLYRCINSIRKFYLNKHIILINDSPEKYDIVKIFSEHKNIQIIKSYKKGSADQQIFKVLLETTLFDKAIFIQDSMILNKKIEHIEKINDIMFIWPASNHRVHWDKIKEKPTKYNKDNNIKTHTDLIKHYLFKDYSNVIDFQKNAVENLTKFKDNWYNCMGCCCIMTRKNIYHMNNNTGFAEKFINYDTNRLRRVNESIFPLLCNYYFPNVDFSKSINGFYYDGSLSWKFNKRDELAGIDNLRWCVVNEYFSKISFNR